MQFINVFSTVLLLALTVVAAPGNKDIESPPRKRWWWEGINEWGYKGSHHTSGDSSIEHESSTAISLLTTSNPSMVMTSSTMTSSMMTSLPPITTWTSVPIINTASLARTNSSFYVTNSSSCATPITSTITISVSITVTTTVTQYRTSHSLLTKNSTSHIIVPSGTAYSTGLPRSSRLTSILYTNATSTSNPLNTAYSTGLPSSSRLTSVLFSNATNSRVPFSTAYSTGSPSSSAPVPIIYTNATSTSIPLSTAYSTGLPYSSRLTSVLFPNTTSIHVAPFTTYQNTHSQKHHSHHKATSITVSSSIVFIAASSSIPPTGSSASKLTTELPITATISGTAAPTGIPLPHALLCGVHGYPIGDFFLGQLVDAKPGMDITLRTCYEFCVGIYGVDMGCLSIEFFPEPGTNAPRCNLYGGDVADSLDEVIPEVPNVWYDLGCDVTTG